MIKKIAHVDNMHICRQCNRTIKKDEQYLSHKLVTAGIFAVHVLCIMDLCGQELTPGMVWKTQEEIETDEFLRIARVKIAQGKSLLDA